MVNSRVQKFIEKTLDLFDRAITPRRWPVAMRRTYVITFPISSLLLGIVTILVMSTVLVAAITCFLLATVLGFFDYVRELWSAEDKP